MEHPMRTVFRMLAVVLLSTSTVTAGNDGHLFMPPPGKLVDVGGHRLHIDCRGSGHPVVLIDTGLGDLALTWQSVQLEVARYTRICVYDRAGYGYSDPGPPPRITSQIVKELHTLMGAADLTPPFVLVGHSFGGYNVRYYASRFPDEVSGLVLVDAAHPEQHRVFPVYRSAGDCLISPNMNCQRLLRPKMPDNLPEAARLTVFKLLASPKHRQTYLDELEGFAASAKEVLAARALPDIPILVVSRGRRMWPETTDGYTKEAAWQGMQSDLESVARRTTRIVDPDSGHLMHLDDPMLVARVVFSAVIISRLGQAGVNEVFVPTHLADR
jgi:pimeloyl-ACP methyl ester carboxylesterase